MLKSRLGSLPPESTQAVRRSSINVGVNDWLPSRGTQDCSGKTVVPLMNRGDVAVVSSVTRSSPELHVPVVYGPNSASMTAPRRKPAAGPEQVVQSVMRNVISYPPGSPSPKITRSVVSGQPGIAEQVAGGAPAFTAGVAAATHARSTAAIARSGFISLFLPLPPVRPHRGRSVRWSAWIDRHSRRERRFTRSGGPMRVFQSSRVALPHVSV